jgi:hypothetical protein
VTHKTVNLKGDFPYSKTTVAFEKSLADIQTLLAKFGCGRIGTLRDPRGDETLWTLVFEHRGLQYMIEFPVTYRQQANGAKLDMRVSGRIILNRIKSSLIDAEIGYMDFSQALGQYLVVPGKSGPQAMMDYVAEQHGQLAQGTFSLQFLPQGERP